MNSITIKMFSSNIEEKTEELKELKRFMENYVIVLDKPISKEVEERWKNLYLNLK